MEPSSLLSLHPPFPAPKPDEGNGGSWWESITPPSGSSASSPKSDTHKKNNEDDGHSFFFFSAPTSPRRVLEKKPVSEDETEAEETEEGGLDVGGIGMGERRNGHSDEFEFSACVSESDEAPASPTLAATSTMSFDRSFFIPATSRNPPGLMLKRAPPPPPLPLPARKTTFSPTSSFSSSPVSVRELMAAETMPHNVPKSPRSPRLPTLPVPSSPPLSSRPHSPKVVAMADTIANPSPKAAAPIPPPSAKEAELNGDGLERMERRSQSAGTPQPRSSLLDEENTDNDDEEREREDGQVSAPGGWKSRFKNLFSRSYGDERRRVPLRPTIPNSWPSSSYPPLDPLTAAKRKGQNGTSTKAPSPSPPLSPRSPRKSSAAAAAVIAPSPHEVLYRSQRAQIRQLKKKTPLPYRQGFLGCLGFASKSYGAQAEFTRGLQPIS